MLATMEIVDVLDRAEGIGQMILQSETMKTYEEAKHRLEQNEEAQKLISNFIKLKDQYEEVQRFGRYHPDYSKITKEVRTVKREMDMHEAVSTYKRAETELQALLDDVSAILAEEVSPSIKVPRDGAVFKDKGCGCGSGGSCGCAS
ncbi:YlbF family regulator [Salinibacillus xinjiangensis]|uniref:YlbF family regulator n=1 Tax=Salinibacillus xinjiangensis TaxID=1229268 RepID=A0A6G1X3M3_9BACI|nr:YlbF family regulator [Salinibacillus xinjiangensis]MRG85519.1 YlbF family regulator [Salinibacillus xinjiangensis]